MSRVAEWLIARAQRHPYYHLTRPNGFIYMRRWWLFGHGTDRDRDDRVPHKPMLNPAVGHFARWWARHVCVIRVHHTLLSDRDRDLHDHPAWNVSIVLRGGYWELVPEPAIGSKWPLAYLPDGHPLEPAGSDQYVAERCIARWRGPGSVVIRRAAQRHKLVLPLGQESWSLFCVGKKSNEWGFYVGAYKIPWREYESAHSGSIDVGRKV